jgi:hypothetical protein
MDRLPRNLEALESLLLERQIALHLAEANRGQAMVRVYDWSDDAAMVELAPYNEAVEAAERKVEAVKELLSYLTPSSYQVNGR